MKRTLLALSIFGSLIGCSKHVDLIDYVDTRVGSDANSIYTEARYGKGSEEYGMTLPAVLEPNGMNCWTPQTSDSERKCVSPYYYRDSLFQGFRNSHWIVGGCTQDYGSFTLFPSTATDKLTPMERATAFRHGNETASPAYYSVYLHESGIRAEMTARSRSAIFRLSYPEGQPACLIVNPNSDEGQGYIEIDTLKKEIRGYNPIHRIYQGWGKPAGYSGYFVIRYREEVEAFGTFCGDSVRCSGTSIGNARAIGLFVRFKHKGASPIIIKAGSSFTDLEGARNNLDAEIPGFDFDRTRKYLTACWEKRLSKISVESEDSLMMRKFYGSLYRSSILPRVISDVDGRYPAFAGGSPILQASVPHYDDFSMWDTYRALHPLLNITSPSMSGEMMQSLVDKYKQGGWLPIFPCWNSYTAAMIGDHCIAAIGDAYVKGVRNFDVETAYEGMRKNAFVSPESQEEYVNGMGRRALKSYLQYGYIPLEDPVKEAFHSREQTSRTLEYAFDDFVLSQVAKSLGKEDDYEALRQRSQNYKNVIDPASGYANGRHEDGSFFEGNRPEVLSRYITEGAPCHYSWYVPHDPYGLMEAMGGRENYLAKLDSLFQEGLYWHGNEPCHQVAYMYDYAGEPWKTQNAVREILDSQYADLPGGLAGNDDAGQMSAWFVFSSLGFYPVCPGSPYYAIGSPQFDKAEFRLENGRRFTIVSTKEGKDNRYIQSARLNGEKYSKNYISHEDIMKGGRLEFVMGDSPAKNWGSEASDCIPSL
ncbi:MAG: GH92 family glycosyl hydrolase [Bacteroidales bacterium]|nr:GH92 family glycosyl hydrolase [Bacteroidales bacterium]